MKYLKIAVYDRSDDSFGELWDIEESYQAAIEELLANEQTLAIYQLLKEKGRIIKSGCDYWIDIGA